MEVKIDERIFCGDRAAGCDLCPEWLRGRSGVQGVRQWGRGPLRRRRALLWRGGECPEIRFAVGEHPNSVGTENESYLDEEKDYFLERLLKEKAVCAIKTGLDFYRGKENSVRQTERFRRRIRQARKYRLPLVLHVRDAHEKALEILREESEGKMYQGVIHCFTEKPTVAWEYIKLGFCVGIGGKITSPRFDSLRETVKELPLEWIVLETDAPFVPLYGNVYGNGSCDIPKIAEQVAKIKGEILEEVAEQTYQNAEKIFG